MALFKLDDLIKPIVWTEARDALYAMYAKLEINTTAWGSGAVVRSMTVAFSSMVEALSELQAEAIRGRYLEYARGPWLRMKARFDYYVEPLDATFATGELTLINTGGGLYSVDAGDLIVRNAVTGKTYRNVADFALAGGGQLTLTVMAEESGTASNANAGAITEFVTVLTGVTCTNPAALIATDEESPAELRARCSEKLGSLSPMGPWDAYTFAARSAKLSTGESVGVTRILTTRDGFGRVFVRLASASGPVTGTVGDLATVIGAVDDAIGKLAEPLAVTALVSAAEAVSITVAYQAWVYNTSGLAEDAIRETIAAALRTFISTHPIGGVKLSPSDAIGYVFAEALPAIIRGALNEVFHVQLITPAADTPLTTAQVAVLVHDPTLHASITLVARPEGTLT